MNLQELEERVIALDTFIALIAKNEPLENKLILTHLNELLTLEKDQLEKMLSLYEQVAVEIRASLEFATDYTFTTQHYYQVLAQVEAGILKMKEAIKGQLSDTELSSRLLSLDHLVSEITFFEAQYAGSLQVINLRVATMMDDMEQFRLLQYQTSVDTYGLNLIYEIQDIMTKAVLSQKFFSELKEEIMDTIEAKEWKAAEIIRTELNNAYNETHLVGLKEASEEIPGLKKQWNATLDNRTGKDSISLNGQVKEINEPFIWKGKEYQRPPIRPNDRCRLVGYKEEWENA